MHLLPFDGSIVCWICLGGALAAAATLVWIGGRWGVFPCSTFGALLACAAVIWSGPALAQTAARSTQDLVDQSLRRAEAAKRDLSAWASSVDGVQNRHAAEAQAIVEGNSAALKRGLGMLNAQDFPNASAMGDLQGERPRDGALYIAVSFSMPANDLRRLARDANKAGATLVVRGLVNGSFKETLAASKRVFDETSPSGLAIDPGVFRTYRISQVPVFIAATAPVEPCGSGLDCVSPPPPSDQVAGNMSLGAALEILSSRGRQAPIIANAALRRLRG